MKVRRGLLTAHLVVGFALVAALTATEVFGTLNYYDHFGGGGYTNRYNTWHLGVAVGSTALFAGQAALALAAPNPYPSSSGWSAGRWHRILMTAAAVGMAAQVALGPISAASFGQNYQPQLAEAHLIIGYVTYALVIGGILAWVSK
jgi:hypothetical protein